MISKRTKFIFSAIASPALLITLLVLGQDVRAEPNVTTAGSLLTSGDHSTIQGYCDDFSKRAHDIMSDRQSRQSKSEVMSVPGNNEYQALVDQAYTYEVAGTKAKQTIVANRFSRNYGQSCLSYLKRNKI